MNYLTPDLLALFQTTDAAAAASVAEQWDQRCEAYRARLKALRPELPTGVRSFLRRYRPPDAKMLTMTADDKRRFSIFLDFGKAVGPEDRYVELRYQFAGADGPGYVFRHHAELSGHGKPFSLWLYDEIDAGPAASQEMVHSILLTGGWELQLIFARLRVRRLPFSLSPGKCGGNENAGAPTGVGMFAFS